MKKSTKGALAAASGAALLLGGAGSLAYWSDSKDVGSAEIQSGSFSLGAPDFTGAGLHDWQLDNGDAYVPGTTKVVPGDTITKVVDLPLTLTGEHIGATLSIGNPSLTADETDLADELTTSATFTIDGEEVNEVSGPGDYTVRATVSVDFDGPAATNASQNGDVNLDAINVVATQSHTP